RAASSEYAAMFMDEARLAMRLNHPNVVQTYEVGVDDGGLFLAMEYLEGQPLHRFVQAMAAHEAHLSHAHLARIASEALAGLHYAHELADYDGKALQIVHRDVSPHNVFVTYEGQIKVVDFGIAKATMNEVHTRTGDVKGKIAYMAPEQAVAENVDRRADIFSIGVILWEMIARRRLLTGNGSAEILDALLTMDFPPLSCEVPDVHPVLEVIVMRALQRDPADRYATAAEMREALESYVGMAGQIVRASDIGNAVNKLFADSRENRASRIREQMSGARSASGNLLAAGPGAALPTLATSFVGGGDTNGPSVVTGPLARARGDWRTGLAIGVLAFSVVAFASAVIVTMRWSGDRAAGSGASASTELVGVPVPAVLPPPATTETALPVLPPALPAPSAGAAPTPPPPAPPARPFNPPPRRGGPAPGPTTPKRTIDTSFPR
ncbi:MAG TPA: serine/threonine-protein kinase, partial [Labilithrix sp.]|nr:serine/threonine-protein kinase [Labilithrix sp.]